MTSEDFREPVPAGGSTELSAGEQETREEDLHIGLAALTDLVAEALPLAELLSQVAESAERAIPGADGVGISLLRLDETGNRVQLLGASQPFVSQIDVIQYELVDEGPCITAALELRTTRSGSLGGDRRWPRFGPRVSRLGVHSVLSLPMILPNTTVVGAINTYSRTKDVFDDDAARVGALFAAPAAVAVHNAHVLAQALARAAQLQVALVSRATIDQAIGILRSRSGATAEQSFARLRELSQTENIKLAVVAERVVEEAVRRARARHTS